MLYDVDAGHSTFLEDCYECEARIPAGAWGPASIPWADVVSKTKQKNVILASIESSCVLTDTLIIYCDK